MDVTVQIPDQVARGRSLDDLATDLRRLAVLDAFRRGELSSGRAAALLGMQRVAFLEYAATRGIPTMNYDEQDFARELSAIHAHSS